MYVLRCKPNTMQIEKPRLINKKRLLIGLVILALAGGIFAGGFFAGKASQSTNPKSKSTASKSQGGSAKNSPGSPQNAKNQQEQSKQSADRLRDRIKSAVEKQSLTKEQGDKLLSKLDEVTKFNNSIASKSSEERSKLITDKRNELRAWAEKNSIPTSYITMMVIRF